MSKYAKARQDNRMKDYKQSFNADDFKKRREESIISIRRQRREENILKRRNMDITEEVDVNAQNYNNHTVQQLNLLPDFVREVSSNDVNLQISGTIGIRRLLSIQINPPIDEVIHSGVIPTLVQFLGRVDNTKLQFEAAWALTNVASGNTQQTLAIIHAHAIPAFVAQLGSPEVSVREQAVWALGNIAGDSYQCRDELLNNNVLARLLPLTMEQNIKPSLRRNAVWTISNLCRGKPAPPFPVVSIAIPYLAELIKSNDAQVVTDACWALSYLSDGDNARIQAVIEAGICERVVVNLMHQSQAVQTPSLRIVGNIVTGDDVQTQHVIDYHVLPRLKNMLDNPSIKKAIKKEVCWTISNITAGPSYQIQAVMDANIFESLIHHLIYSDFDVKKEAAWAIANATSSGSLEQIKFMVSKGCIRPLCDLLETNDARIVAVALEALENILERGNVDNDNDNDTEEENNYALAIEDAAGVPAIEKLQLHVNQSIADKASSIISKYFNADTEEETDDEELAPTSNQDSFSFGMGGGNNTFHFS